MEENYKTKAILKGMMSSNREVGRALALPKKQQEVLDIMVKHNITTDLNKLPTYKKEAFLKDVKNKVGMGFEARTAFQSAYGAKPISAKPETKEVKMKSLYNEIVNKNKQKASSKITENSVVNASKKASIFSFGFGTSSKGLREAQSKGLLAETEKPVAADNYQDTMESLKRIQSK